MRKGEACRIKMLTLPPKKMISKAKIKFIHSLELKKNRTAEGLFVAEGPKVVRELMRVASPRLVVACEAWLRENRPPTETEVLCVSDEELQKASLLKTPQQVIGVFPKFSTEEKNLKPIETEDLTLMLDGVQDPGNLGTIVRIADWFGIRRIICSLDTADVYNPKVVQSTMGSIARVRVEYGDLDVLLDALPANCPIYGTMLDGEDLFAHPSLVPHGVVVMGNEGRGLSLPIRKRIKQTLLIPSFPKGVETAESLNVAVATAIVCAELRRRGVAGNP
jgi:trmH family RNA methyltransferase